MASDQLRKKWGTIFMGDREASPQQLDAMQEPLLRERAQQQHQEDYLARVRARAEERAREILGAAYTERQKVLEEAGAEAQTRILQLTREALALKAQAQEELAQAQAEHGKARELREEAEIIRDNAHNDGFQAGMAQAGAELKEFRADVGQMLGNMLQALEAQRHSLGEAWREELAELARVAVEAGTGWVLQAEHARILQHLVFSSLQLLEDRATVSVRVHPDDEETVGDLFRAARERVPELNQWIVNGDASVEAGGLVAESVSGSVENLRSHYREMVNGILDHLTLPHRPQDGQAEQAAGVAAAEGLAHLAEMMPQEQAPQAEVPATLPPTLADGPEMEQEADADLGINADPDMMGEVPSGPANDAAEALAAGMDNADLDALAHPDAAAMPDGFDDPGQQPQEMFQPEGLPQPEGHPEGQPEGQPAGIAQDQQLFDGDPAVHADGADMPQHIPAAEAFAVQQHEAHAANPSLAELEDELFPLPEENDYMAQAAIGQDVPSQAESGHPGSVKADSVQADSSVFVSGGFLPGSGNG